MSSNPSLKPLIDHLCANSRLQADEAQKLVAEVVAYFDETPEQFVRRRHRELRRETGSSNERIFTQITDEMPRQAFAAPRLSQRQIRRIIYG